MADLLKNNLRSKRKGPDAAPPWMLTFSDLMQQLVCFFVLLLAMSEFDTSQIQKLSEAYKLLFQKGGLESVNKTPEKFPMPPTDQPPNKLYGAPISTPTPGLEILVENTDRGKRINLNYSSHFEEGSATVPDEIKSIMDFVITKYLSGSYRVIEIRGYTATNIEDSINGDFILLSYQRARNIYTLLTAPSKKDKDVPKILPARLRIIACGKNAPLLNDLTNKDKRKFNRRVEIIRTEEIIKSTY